MEEHTKSSNVNPWVVVIAVILILVLIAYAATKAFNNNTGKDAEQSMTPTASTATETPETQQTPTATVTVEPTVTEMLPTETAVDVTPTPAVLEEEVPVDIRAGGLLDAELIQSDQVMSGVTLEEILIDDEGRNSWIIVHDGERGESILTDFALYTYEYHPDGNRLKTEEDVLGSGVPVDIRALFGDDPFLDDDAERPDELQDGQFIRLSLYADYIFTNDAGEVLGEVGNLLIDTETMQVSYAVVDIGVFLGVGEKTILIPWSLLELQEVEGETYQKRFVLADVDRQRLEDAPEVDLAEIAFTDQDWDEQFAAYWFGEE